MASGQRLAQICKVLSVAARVRIIELLRGRVLCVGALSGRLEITQGAVSQHLRILREGGFVTAEKRGNFVHYRLDEDALAKCRKLLNGALQADASGSVGCKIRPSKERKRPCARKSKRTNARSRKS